MKYEKIDWPSASIVLETLEPKNLEVIIQRTKSRKWAMVIGASRINYVLMTQRKKIREWTDPASILSLLEGKNIKYVKFYLEQELNDTEII